MPGFVVFLFFQNLFGFDDFWEFWLFDFRREGDFNTSCLRDLTVLIISLFTSSPWCWGDYPFVPIFIRAVTEWIFCTPYGLQLAHFNVLFFDDLDKCLDPLLWRFLLLSSDEHVIAADIDPVNLHRPNPKNCPARTQRTAQNEPKNWAEQTKNTGELEPEKLHSLNQKNGTACTRKIAQPQPKKIYSLKPKNCTGRTLRTR